MRFLIAFLGLLLALPSHGMAQGTGSTLYGDILAEFHLSYYKGELKTDSPTGFFGVQDNGGGNQRLGVLEPETDGDYKNTEIGLRLPIKKTPWDVFFAGNFGSTDIDGIAGDFDAGAQTIILPGAGRVGFGVLGPNGVADSLRYRHDYDWANGEIGLGYAFKTDSKFKTVLRPFGGLQYGHLNTNETFSGNLPIVIRQFRYDTNINNDVISPFIGLAAQTRPTAFFDSFFTPIELNGSLRYDLNFNDAKGTDSLSFTGFPIDSIAISENDKTHNISIDLGLTFNPDGPLRFAIGGQYQRIGNVPKLSRDGAANSNLSFEKADIWAGTVRASLIF